MFDYHIINDITPDKKWVAITPVGKAQLLLLNDAGQISKSLIFETSFLCEFVTMDKIDENSYLMVLGILGRSASYKVDLISDTICPEQTK